MGAMQSVLERIYAVKREDVSAVEGDAMRPRLRAYEEANGKAAVRRRKASERLKAGLQLARRRLQCAALACVPSTKMTAS